MKIKERKQKKNKRKTKGKGKEGRRKEEEKTKGRSSSRNHKQKFSKDTYPEGRAERLVRPLEVFTNRVILALSLDALVEIHIILPAVLGLVRVRETSVELNSLNLKIVGHCMRVVKGAVVEESKKMFRQLKKKEKEEKRKKEKKNSIL